MDYEKAYKAVLKTATQWIKDGCTDKEKICLECVFPELRESEDERIISQIVSLLETYDGDEEHCHIVSECITWLEKQKINTDGDFARGYDCGYQCCLNSHGAEWLEKRKEQKPIVMNTPRYSPPEQKPAEWSEEDEKMLNEILDSVTYAFYDQGNEGEIEDDPAFLWLHRLRPSWKPSGEQMEALKKVAYNLVGTGTETDIHLVQLYEQLKKLGVKEEPEYYQHFEPDC